MTLSFISTVWSAFAGTCLAIGCIHFFVWVKRSAFRAHLAFFFVALSVAAVILAELMLLQSKNATEFGLVLRWAHVPIFTFVASAVVFLRIYFRAGRLSLAYAAVGLRMAALIANFASHPNLNYQTITGLRHVTLWNGEVVSFAIGVANPWQAIGAASSLALVLFIVDVMLTSWRRGNAIERRRALVIGCGFLTVVIIVAINSALIHLSVIAQPFYLFGSFLFVVVAIGNELSDDVVRSSMLAGKLEQSQSELHRSQRQMELASAAAGVGAWEWDFTRDEVHAAERTRRLYNLGPTETLNLERVLSALHEEDRLMVREAVMQSLKNGLQFQREYRVSNAQGHIRWILSRGRVESGIDDTVPVMRGVSLDISERKLANERFREVVEAAPNGMLIVDKDGKIVLINAQVEADFGYSREELVGQPVELLIPERFHAEHKDYRGGFDARKRVRTMARGQDIVGRCKDGNEIPLEVRLNPLHGTQGVEVLASVRNISDQRQREEQLRQERAFLRQIIDINPNLIFAKNREGQFILVNQAVADIYGSSTDDMIGKTDADFNSNREEVIAFRRADLDVMDSLQQAVILDEPITDATGKLHWLQTVKVPILEKNGRADHVLGTSTDVSERKRVELELAQQRNELAHLSRVMMLSELSGSLAHELNQPLAAILSNAQAALRFIEHETPDLNEIRAILHDIVDDDKRAGEVIQGLRQLLKKGEVQLEALDANKLVESVLKLLRSDMLNAGVAHSTCFAPDLPKIHGIVVQLQQVLLNLMVNACDAMVDVAAPDRELVITTELSDTCVMFCVHDRGPGLAANHEAQIFEPFFTTKTQGLGLGLAVCFKLIAAHGGRIWAANNDGGGARFCFTVPANREGNHEQRCA